MVALLAVIALLQPAVALRTDEDPDDFPSGSDSGGSGSGSDDSFSDGLSGHEDKLESQINPALEEDKYRPLVIPEVSEARQATMVASEAANRANDATQRAKQEAEIAEQALINSKKQAAEAKAAKYQAMRSGIEAKASMVRAHLEQVEAVASKKIHSLVMEADRTIEEKNAQTDFNVKSVMHKAAVSIKTAQINRDHKLKEVELATARDIHDLESEAARKVHEQERFYNTREEERVKEIQMRTVQRIQNAEEASFARIKRSEESSELDLQTVRSENNAVLKAQTEHIIRIHAAADVQVKKQADIAEETLGRIEARKQRTIARGKVAMETSLKTEKERAERKVAKQENSVIYKVKNTDPQIKDLHTSAEWKIQHNTDEADRKIERATATFNRKNKENLERYVTDSAQVARLRQNQVMERTAVSKQAADQAESVKKRMVEWDKESTAARAAFEKAAAVVREAKEATIKAKLNLDKVARESMRDDKAVVAEMAAAAAQQKAKDSQMYAEKVTTLAKIDQERVAQASTNPILLGGVPYGNVDDFSNDTGSGSSGSGSAGSGSVSALLSEDDALWKEGRLATSGSLGDWHAELNEIHDSA
jgi:hypothetical protein